MPLPPPVTTAVRSCQRVQPSGQSSVLMKTFLTSVNESRASGSELAAEAGLLEPAERRRVAHRRVRVDRQVAGLDRRGRPAAPGRRRGSRSSRTGRTRCRWPAAIASASSSNGSTATTGPKTSSRQIRSCGAARQHDGRRVPEAGPVRAPCRGRRRRPSSSTYADTLSRCPALISGPISASSSPGAATRTPGDGGLEQLEEPVVHAALDEDPAARAAVLAGVVEDAVRRGRRGLLEVGVGEHDVRALAAELEGHPLHLARRRRAMMPRADLGRAGEARSCAPAGG